VKYLIDTCVISELVKPRPNRAVVGWLRDCDEERLFLSVLTIGELQKGIARLPPSKRRTSLEMWVDQNLRDRFAERTLPVDVEVAERWGQLVADAERRGEPVPAIDSLIAATALTHGLTIITRNTDDMRRCGASVLDPWGRQARAS